MKREALEHPKLRRLALRLERDGYAAKGFGRITATGLLERLWGATANFAPDGRIGRFSPEEIAENFEHLNLAQVHAALAYYHANREEIESDLAALEAESKAWEQEFAPRLAG